MTNKVYRRTKQTQAQRVLPLCLCVLVGFGSMTLPAQAQSNDVNNRIKRLENELETLNRAIYKGERPPVAASSGGSEATAAAEIRLGQIETEIRNLTGKVEQQAYDTQQLQQKLEALEQDARMRLDSVEGQLRAGAAPAAGGGVPPHAPMVDTNTIPPMAPDGTPAILQPAPSAPADQITGNETGASDAAGLYEQGFAEIKQGNYDAAEKTFAGFMKQYPTHALAPNALYWLGETYYVRKQYDKAARVFAEAYQKYPDGPKGADNLLKLGMSLSGKGEKDNACIALRQLAKQYPDGPAPVLTRGQQEISTLGCPV